MSNTSARELYDFTVAMNDRFQELSGGTALNGSNLATDYADLISKFLTMARDTGDEIMRADFPYEGRADDLFDRLNKARVSILNAISSRGGTSAKGPLVSDVVIERLLSIAEQIENSGIFKSEQLDREFMVSETEALLAEVKEWDIEDYAKHTLLVQLNNIVRIIHAADTYSEAELRLRVKSIIADFASEFADMDKKYQTKLDRIVLWARRGFFAGTVLLGLTADLSSVTALLPSPAKMIGKG